MFAGYEWYVENSGADRLWKPGPNHWSSSTDNVWVDGNGWLHLQITCTDGVWYCAELTTLQTLGYGTYKFVVSNNVVTLDKNEVLGLFAYKDDYHEVDIEFTMWSDISKNNTWYTVQPESQVSGISQDAFSPNLEADFSTHYFTWARQYIYFESLQGDQTLTNPPSASIIHSFQSTMSPDAAGVKAHINLWLNKGQAPSDQKNIEVVIKSFTFTPLT
jgi:hypothetical protein